MVEHFLDSLPISEHHRQFGYNKSKIKYPMKRNLEMQQRFLYRLDGFFNLPDRIVPIIDENSTCIHGNSYIAGDGHLRMMSPNITIYTETSDKICSIPTYGRPADGD